MVKDIHNGIQNIKPVLDNQFIVRHTSKGKGGWQWRGNSKPQGTHVAQRRGFPPDSNPRASLTERKWRASQTDHMTHRASLMPAFKLCISKLVSELWMCPTRLDPLREEIDTLWVGGRGLGSQPQHLPCSALHSSHKLHHLIWSYTNQKQDSD